MNVAARLLFPLALLAGSSGLLAQDAIQPYVEYRKRIETAQNISPLDTGLFGEQVSLYNGSTTFSVTDIDVPGHHDLPVRLTRTFSVELQLRNLPGSDYDSMLKGAGNWDVDVPYMAATYSVTSGTLLRCDAAFEGPALFHPFFRRSEVWHGISINVPGRGKTSALSLQTGVPHPAGSTTYKLTTPERDMFECIPMQPGFSGQGFRMTTTSGLRYYFDVGASRTDAALEKWVTHVNSPLPELIQLERNKLYLLASRIEDRFGNTVQFQYNANGHPTRIWANDGREISLSYTNGRLATATSHGQTWQYQYAGSPVSGMYAWLSQVTRPDSSTWQYSYSNSLSLEPTHSLPPLPWCMTDPPITSASFTLTATHPSGASGTFDFSNRRHYRSGVHATECMPWGDPAHENYTLLVPHFYDVMSINSKTLGGPGLPSMAWSYEYGFHMQTLWGTHTQWLPYPCTTCTESKTVTVTHPDDTKSRHTFGIRYHDNDGRELKVETLEADDTVVRTETNIYMTEAEAATQPFHGVYGLVIGGHVLDPASARIRPVTHRTIQQGGVDFIWQANSFDTLARPKSVTRSSTLPGNPMRTEETLHWDNEAKWILGQVNKVTCTAPSGALPAGCGSATTMFERSYDPTYALPLVTKRFGKPEQTLAWNTSAPLAGGQRGTAASVADGNGHATTLGSWKRGIPQLITYPGTPEAPAGATHSALVNDHGWIEWIDDETGARTCYAHDAMGRVSQVTYPSEAAAHACNASTWAVTTQAFQQVAGSEYGIAGGHWRQTVATGNGRKITYFDALWRPVVVREYDTANEAATQRFQRFAYDHAGRTTFASYPASVHNPATGTWTEYDALGRPTSVSQDSELSPSLLVTTSEYLGGFQTRVTDPNGHQTTTAWLAWDQPTTDFPILVAHPAGAWTHIGRDVFGKPTVLRRSNSSSPSGGTVALDRTYTYNPYQELCRSVEPETGATLMGYDGAGNLAWSAAGLPTAQACESGGTSPTVAARRVDRSWDARNRLTTLAFPDGRGNQGWTYTPDGLPATISTHNSSGGDIVGQSYSYNRRRLLVQESLVPDATQSWTLGYGYNANGHLDSQTYPAGLTASYTVNALGQVTQVAAQGATTVILASGVTYFPNGALKGFTYGNGMVHTATQTVRGLPLRVTDCTTTGACASANRRLDLDYAYDRNGNVTAITDHTASARQTRAMSYDARDRLTQTISPMFGTAGYAYDVLDNLTAVDVGGPQARSHVYCYAGNRLATVRTGSCSGSIVHSLGYDVQGNLASKGGETFGFDHGNRLRQVSGVAASYLYDGHGLRVRSSASGSAPHLYSLYDRGGRLRWQRDEVAGQRIRHLYLGGRLLAEHRKPIGSDTETIDYLHVDALGSPIARTDGAKSMLQSSEHEPYGLMLNRPNDNRPGYAGHVMDAGSGLTYMQQRYYDPMLGVFLSADPVTAYSSPISQFHRYRYANNNPYKFTDPDGRLAADEKKDPPPPPEPTTLPPVTATAPPVTLPGITVTAPRPAPVSSPWGGIGGTLVRGGSIPLIFITGMWPYDMGYSSCEMPGGPLCGMMSDQFPPGYKPGPVGAAEWGRRNGVNPREARERFHRGVKGNTKGAGADHDFGVNPETGDVIDPNGESVGNLEDEHG